jgi:nitrite reductase/ring-hydroxylating ferredoxin subunit
LQNKPTAAAVVEPEANLAPDAIWRNKATDVRPNRDFGRTISRENRNTISNFSFAATRHPGARAQVSAASRAWLDIAARAPFCKSSPTCGRRRRAECRGCEGEAFMAEWFVAKAADMADGDRRIVTAGAQEIGVFFKDGDFYAYSNYCLHSGGPACEGLLINRVVDLIAADRTYQGQSFGDEMHFVCPWHGYEYELKTGECVGDRKLKLRKYNVVRRGDDIYVVA